MSVKKMKTGEEVGYDEDTGEIRNITDRFRYINTPDRYIMLYLDKIEDVIQLRTVEAKVLLAISYIVDWRTSVFFTGNIYRQTLMDKTGLSWGTIRNSLVLLARYNFIEKQEEVNCYRLNPTVLWQFDKKARFELIKDLPKGYWDIKWPETKKN